MRNDLISGMRGLAALAVLLFHSFGRVAETSIWPPLEAVRGICLHGWLGVHAFFVISGYCMWAKISAMAAKNEGLPVFLQDRFWRIMPAYWAALLLATLIGLAAAPFNTSGLAGAFPPGWKALWADIFLIHPFLNTPSLLLVSWTLTIEWGFYFLCAFLLFLRRKNAGEKTVFLVLIISGLACLWPALFIPKLIFDQWPAFCLGAAAFYVHNIKRPLTGCLALLAVLVLCMALGRSVSPGIWFVEYGTAFFLILSSAAKPIRGLSGIFLYISALGLYSYSIYLVHAPILARLGMLSSKWIPAQSPWFALYWIFSLVLTLAIARLFYHWVEAPMEKFRHRLKKVPLVS